MGNLPHIAVQVTSLGFYQYLVVLNFLRIAPLSHHRAIRSFTLRESANIKSLSFCLKECRKHVAVVLKSTEMITNGKYVEWVQICWMWKNNSIQNYFYCHLFYFHWCSRTYNCALLITIPFKYLIMFFSF